MIINKESAKPVDVLWHGIIDPQSGVLPGEQYKLEDLILRVHRNPRTRNTDLVYVPYAVSLWKGRDPIVIVSIEEEDLRVLSGNLGCSMREIQEEQGVKGNFGKPRVIAYGGDEREDLGLYEEKMDLLGAKECLIEWACDIVDMMGEPVPLA